MKIFLLVYLSLNLLIVTLRLAHMYSNNYPRIEEMTFNKDLTLVISVMPFIAWAFYLYSGIE